jgi:hypothetical protein
VDANGWKVRVGPGESGPVIPPWHLRPLRWLDLSVGTSHEYLPWSACAPIGPMPWQTNSPGIGHKRAVSSGQCNITLRRGATSK